MATFVSRFRGAIAAVGLGVRSSTGQADADTPTITSGEGAPSASAPDGSVYLRSDGAGATTIYVRADEAWVAVVADGSDFGAEGIEADVIAESTAAAGVTVDGVLLKDGEVTTDTINEETAAAGVTIDGVLLKDGAIRPTVVADPGAAGAIPVSSSGTCALTSGASGETRTLAAPTFAGQELALSFNVDGGGDIVLTVASAVNQTGNNTATFSDAGEHLLLKAVTFGGALRWRVAANDGVVLSTV